MFASLNERAGSRQSRPKDHSLSVQDNARMIEPGYDSLTPEKKETIDAEVQGDRAIGRSHG